MILTSRKVCSRLRLFLRLLRLLRLILRLALHLPQLLQPKEGIPRHSRHFLIHVMIRLLLLPHSTMHLIPLLLLLPLLAQDHIPLLLLLVLLHITRVRVVRDLITQLLQQVQGLQVGVGLILLLLLHHDLQLQHLKD